ncbi:PEP/pyruvate-binding domain-containing protein, partial [Endozoicomonas sp. ONNA2]|uniref:PEP/pyruvate-binding domain-containing protein n=1 Tax=Endozoicomonas sp. ONNA2 TaxID=2828741 RepID=UPI002148441F
MNLTPIFSPLLQNTLVPLPRELSSNNVPAQKPPTYFADDSLQPVKIIKIMPATEVIPTNNGQSRYSGNVGSGGVTDPTSLANRRCRSPVADCHPTDRQQIGGKGMFLWRMKKAGLRVPPFECVTAQVINALEQHPLDIHRLDRYLPGIDRKLKAEPSLTDIRQCLNALPPSEQTKRNNWLAGLAEFIASDDYYEQVKDSAPAQLIRGLRHELGRPSQPVIVRSSGINEDNYGDAQAGK